MRQFFVGPLSDFTGALHRVMPVARWQGMTVALFAVIAVWWIHVPFHELFHVLGCVAVGGTVDRLDIAPEYGGALIARVFPFVSVGSDYPGQLVGFDTGGNDAIYLSTVFAPYLLTIFVGVPLLRELGRRGRPGILDCALLGTSIPLAFSPFINLLGDYYELGSIPVSRIAALLVPGADPELWRSDDLIKLSKALSAADGLAVVDFAVLSSGVLLGSLCALTTYWVGARIHDVVSGILDGRREDRAGPSDSGGV